MLIGQESAPSRGFERRLFTFLRPVSGSPLLHCTRSSGLVTFWPKGKELSGETPLCLLDPVLFYGVASVAFLDFKAFSYRQFEPYSVIFARKSANRTAKHSALA
jgi:hypothetical protein